MRILHIITSIDKGGAENHLFDLCRMQKKNKNKIHVIYFKGNSYWKKNLNAIGVPVSFYNIKGFFSFFFIVLNFFKIYNSLNKFKPDIIHCHLSLSEIYGLIIKLIFKKKYKVIISKHLDSLILEGSYGQKSSIKGVFLEKIIFKYIDYVICISNHVRKYFYTNLKFKKKSVSTIYYGVKYGKLLYKNKIKKKYNFRKDTNYICSVARHIKQKNIYFLLDAFKDILKKYQNKKKFKLILVCIGPETTNLKKYALDRNIYDKIVWINFSDNVREIMSLSNLFCLTSDYEGLGLVLLEAMSVRTPVVATNSSAIPEVIENGKTGILFKKNDKQSFIQSLEKILFNKDLKKKLTNNAIHQLNKKFCINKMYKRTNYVYQKTLKQ